MNSKNTDIGNIKARSTREIDLELLALDLESCTRCVGTLANIETAIAKVKSILDGTGTKINVIKKTIESEEDAKVSRFVSSPTIRIDNHDIVLETLESECDSCTDLCGCEEGTTCRIWKYQGQEFTKAPVGLIVESLMEEIFGGHASPAREETQTYKKVPENLLRFFAGKAEREYKQVSECCVAEEQESCCEPSEKETCCQTEEPSTCGCR